MIFKIKYVDESGSEHPSPEMDPPLEGAYLATVVETERRVYREDRDWYRNYETGEMGWRNSRISEPPKSWFENGFDHEFAETVDTSDWLIHTYTRKVSQSRWMIKIETLKELTEIAEGIQVLIFYDYDELCIGI